MGCTNQDQAYLGFWSVLVSGETVDSDLFLCAHGKGASKPKSRACLCSSWQTKVCCHFWMTSFYETMFIYELQNFPRVSEKLKGTTPASAALKRCLTWACVCWFLMESTPSCKSPVAWILNALPFCWWSRIHSCLLLPPASFWKATCKGGEGQTNLACCMRELQLMGEGPMNCLWYGSAFCLHKNNWGSKQLLLAI